MAPLLAILRKLGNNTLIKTSVFTIVARFTGVALNFLVAILITRKLPPAEAGIILLLMTLVTGIALFSRVGIDQLLVKEISSRDDKIDFRSLFLKRSLLLITLVSAISIIIWLLLSPLMAARLFDDDVNLNYLRLASIAVLFFNLIIVSSFYQRALKHPVASVLSQNALPAITFLALLLIFWNSFPEEQRYIVLYIAALFLAGLIALYNLRDAFRTTSQDTNDTPTADTVPVTGSLFRQSIPLAPISYFSFLMLFADELFVGWLLANDQVALYSVASKLSYILLFFLGALDATIYPRLLAIVKHKAHQTVSFFWQSTALVIGIVWGAAAFMYIFSEILLAVFNQQYIAAKSSLNILLLAQLMRAMSLTFSFMFIIHNKVRFLNIALVLGLVVNLSGNWVLIPKIGIEGAAMATLLGNITLLALVLIFFISHRLLGLQTAEEKST